MNHFESACVRFPPLWNPFRDQRIRGRLSGLGRAREIWEDMWCGAHAICNFYPESTGISNHELYTFRCVCRGGDAPSEKLEEDGGGGVENEWNRSEFLYALTIGIIQVVRTKKQLHTQHALWFLKNMCKNDAKIRHSSACSLILLLKRVVTHSTLKSVAVLHPILWVQTHIYYKNHPQIVLKGTLVMLRLLCEGFPCRPTEQ